MMIPYLQTEFLNSGMTAPTIIPTGSVIPFDHTLNSSTDIAYDRATGKFTIKTAGTFVINWFVSPQTGLSPEGSNFAIAVYNPLLSGQADYPGFMAPEIIAGSGHVKIAPTSGFAVIRVTDEQSGEGGVVFGLQNVSSHDAALSERTHVKAGLIAFGISNSGGGVKPVMAYGQWQASGWDKNTNPYNLENEEAIKFSNAILAPIGIIASDSEDGGGTRVGFDIFTLQKAGVYQVSWEIPIEATYSIDEVEICLELNGSTVYSRAYSPLPIGTISGTAIVATNLDNQTLSLLNYQPGAGNIIQIGNYANLAIHQIS